ncbi:MAG: CpaF family protein [Ilumatobacteraceae bacterium]
MNSSTPTIPDVARAIATALADDRVRRHNEDQLPPSIDEERQMARLTAAGVLARSRPPDAWGFDAIPEPNDRRIIDEAIAQVLGLGRLEPLLEDDEISDIHIRGNYPVWIKTRDGQRREYPPIVQSDSELVELIRRIASRMGHREQRFDPAHPELNLQLPDGSRLFAAMEISTHPTLVIRRHRFEFSAISQLTEKRMMEPQVGSFLAAAVRSKKNIIVAGGTGSGKTTLLRALINEVGPHERIVTIEDAYELGIDNFQDAHPDHDALQARAANIEGHGEITMADLTRMALRMDPDRVVVGEVRGGEAFPMLLAMSQGNNGSMCTLHADSARSVFPKLLAYVSMASTGVPTETVNLLIASAIHFVVHVEVRDNVRRITSIHEVVDADGNSIVSNEIYSISSNTPQFVALRGATAAQLEEHGFPRARELSWI